VADPAPAAPSWTGAQWRLDPGAADAWGDLAVQRVEVRLDLQWALLLRASGPELGRGRWLWAQAGRDAAGWHLLRCAVHAALHRPRPPIWGRARGPERL
jgi:hypothetical protein